MQNSQMLHRPKNGGKPRFPPMQKGWRVWGAHSGTGFLGCAPKSGRPAFLSTLVCPKSRTQIRRKTPASPAVFLWRERCDRPAGGAGPGSRTLSGAQQPLPMRYPTCVSCRQSTGRSDRAGRPYDRASVAGAVVRRVRSPRGHCCTFPAAWSHTLKPRPRASGRCFQSSETCCGCAKVMLRLRYGSGAVHPARAFRSSR